MAREVQILTWCDACADEDQRTPGATYTPNHGRRSLDLCDAHHAELLSRLEALLDAYGIQEGQEGRRKPGRPRKAQAPSGAVAAPPGRFPCLLCGTSHNANGMGGHLRRMHGSTIGQAYGSICPVCGKASTGTHLGRMHPDESQGQGMVGAFAWARAHGDPHGVVAAAELATRRKAG